MAQIELVADVIHMIPYGLRTDRVIAGHLLGAPATRNPGQDLTLAVAQARLSGCAGIEHGRTNGRGQLVGAIGRLSHQSWHARTATLTGPQQGAGKSRERSLDDDRGPVQVDRLLD